MVLKKFKYKKVSSTNDIAMQKIRQGYKSGVIISDKQTRGRGQHGKKWVSNKGNLFFSIFFTQISGFYFLAATIGLFQGGVQSISRTIFSQLIPVGKSAEFFGFYNLVGKSAVVFGPIMVGWVAYTFDNPDFGILSLLLLFIPGLLVLWMVPKIR